jgi:error-prone DNA polymerase
MNTKQLRLAQLEEKHLTVNVRSHPLRPFREDLNSKGFATSRGLRHKRDGTRVKVAGRLILVHTPPTRSGVRVMFITAEDEWGLIDLVLFPKQQELYARTVLSERICLFEGLVRRVGQGGVSVVIERVLCLEDFLRGLK